jgi:hypothetical protein
MAQQMAAQPQTLAGTAPAVQAVTSPKNPDAPVFVRVLIVGLVAIAIASLLVLLLGAPISATGAGAAAGVLALSTGLAVGIERVLEGFWTLMDQMATQSSWPFASEAKQLEAFTNQFGTFAKPGLDSARSVLSSLPQQAPGVYDQFTQDIDTLKQAVDTVASALDPGTLPAALSSAQTALRSIALQVESPEVRSQVQFAAAGLTTIAQLANSLADNPGRRMMSLFGGALLGLLAAAVLGLDLIHAALGVAPPATSTLRDGLATWWNAGASHWPWAMVATGLLIGLGSNPTHEVIQAIQTYKQQQAKKP